MLNYGEELVYWYLRLNGFFLLDNFVLHQSRSISGRASDTDILAVRFPFVVEETGGNSDDWDSGLFSHFGETSIIGLICEVKTGRSPNIQNLFKPSNIEKAIGRFGFLPDTRVFSDQLSDIAIVTSGQFQIGKILFSRKKTSLTTNALHMKLVDVNRFIKQRFSKYCDRKFEDRMFFPSSLMQYILWEEKRKRIASEAVNKQR
ncbi:MAG: hypothetical protein N2645_10645 [Clostridia bacterium]|nr:hypothetical protein [Clostridia bacterium]